jgi:hypothetical protein
MKEAKHVDIDSDMEVTTKQDKNSYMIRDGVRERRTSVSGDASTLKAVQIPSKGLLPV